MLKRTFFVRKGWLYQSSHFTFSLMMLYTCTLRTYLTMMAAGIYQNGKRLLQISSSPSRDMTATSSELPLVSTWKGSCLDSRSAHLVFERHAHARCTTKCPVLAAVCGHRYTTIWRARYSTCCTVIGTKPQKTCPNPKSWPKDDNFMNVPIATMNMKYDLISMHKKSKSFRIYLYFFKPHAMDCQSTGHIHVRDIFST